MKIYKNSILWGNFTTKNNMELYYLVKDLLERPTIDLCVKKVSIFTLVSTYI